MPDSEEQACYACPDTHEPLVREVSQLVCQRTGRRFSIVGGIPYFLRYDPVEDAESIDRLRSLNETARKEGWRVALERNWPDVVGYVTDKGRLAFIDLLPVSEESRVLEIGAGLGQHTVALAQQARVVHALEVVPGQAEFVAQRCVQSGFKNVFVACGGDDCCLPYADGCFDLVVANLVFEWCGTRERRLRPMEAQQRLLHEIRRVLKSEGVLFLATKNRYAIRYVLGGRDEHMNGMRFGNALPRWMGSLCARRQRRQTRGMLHSYGALQKSLSLSGFGMSRSYWAIPDMRYPKLYVPADPPSIQKVQDNKEFFKGESRSVQLMRLVPARLVKFVAPGLVFLARATGGPKGSCTAKPSRSHACTQT